MGVETIQSVARASSLLRVLAAEGRYIPLGELAEAVRLPKSTAYGLVQTLVQEGLVEHDPRTGCYAAAPGVMLPALPGGEVER